MSANDVESATVGHFRLKSLRREGTNSVKWDQLAQTFGRGDVLPMWVADGDLPCLPQISAALLKRAQHEVFGYTFTPDSFHKALQLWSSTRLGWNVQQEWHVHVPGVISALNIALLAFCQPGDCIVVQPPVYHRFFDAIRDGGYEVSPNPLQLVRGHYEMDFDDLERLFKQGAKMFILCSPHNPVGRTWTINELKEVLRLVHAYDVFLFSDEVFSDLILPGHVHTPILKLYQPLSPRTILCNSPGKTFNIAGLQMSNIWIPDRGVRDKFTAMGNRCGNPKPNIFGLVAAEAAYHYGSEWLNQFINCINENFSIVRDSLSREESVQLIEPESTYLAWLDFRKLGLHDQDLIGLVTNKARLGLTPGVECGKGGEGFLRMNLSCDRETTQEAMERLHNALC